MLAPALRNTAAVSSTKTRISIAYASYILLIVLNIGIPKGGVAIGELPLTFGYIMLLALMPLGLIFVVRRAEISFTATANFLFGYVPVGALVLLKLAYFGTSYSLLVYTSLLLVFPALMLLLYAPVLEALSERQIGTPLVWCVRIVVVWGLLNFVIFAFTKQFIEIPYITVNPLDLGEIYQKNNRRGILMKLVGTSNNGNLFGVCLIMLFPIYAYFERSRAFIAALCLALILTLSRTVWLGLAMLVTMMAALKLIRLGKPSVWLSIAALAFVVIAALPFMGWTMDRVVEARMGGRMNYWNELVLSPFGGSDIRITEVLYASLLQSVGIFGTLSALVALCFPLVYGLNRLDHLSKLQRNALAGIAAYMFMAFSDAAFIYPPTIVIFLFLVILLYRRGYRLDALAETAPIEAALPRGRTLSLAQAANAVSRR